MKKTICALLIVVLTLSVFAGCASKAPADTTAASDMTAAVDTTAAPDTAEAADTTEAVGTTEAIETTEAAGPLTEGTLVISDLISVEFKDGWYSEEGLDTTWNSIELVNDSVEGFLANVGIKVGNVYGDGDAAYWADAINGNYGGGGTVTTEEINGVTYYHLSGVVDDDTQNMFFTDLDDSHYLEVSVMFMPVDQGMPVFDLITFLN